jgi:hypothetical protein
MSDEPFAIVRFLESCVTGEQTMADMSQNPTINVTEYHRGRLEATQQILENIKRNLDAWDGIF